MAINPIRKVQIKGQIKVKTLILDKIPTIISAQYSNYNNVFLAKNVAKLLDLAEINDYATKLEEDKQPLFGQIYSLELVELKILKTYIKTNLANNFI